MPEPTLLVQGRVIPIAGTLGDGCGERERRFVSDAGRYRSLDDRLARAADRIDAGADLIDVGGESAITGRPETDPTEERDRVVPIVEWSFAATPMSS